MSDALLFPVGQYLGPVHATPGAPPRHHLVRVGWSTHALADGLEADVWSLAHGHPAVVGPSPWTRELLTAVAADAGLPPVDAVVTELVGRGLAVEVRPGTDGAGRFARAYRWHSLLTGLGEAGPGREALGLLGAAPVREVDVAVHDWWAWAHLFPDLHAAATGLAEMVAAVPGATPAQTDPEQVLTGITSSLHELLCVSAGHLDVVRARP